MAMATGDLSWPLRRAASLFGEAPAVAVGERSVTYRELAARVGALGGVLEDLGVGEGGRVGFLGVNSLAHLECWLGVPAFGRVIADFNFRLAPDELTFMVDDAGVEVLLADAERVHVAHALAERCPSVHRVLDEAAYEELVQREPVTPRGSRGDDTLAAISYTGGTMGRPKGVMLSHGNLLANAQHNLIATGHRAGQRWLHVCPMFHVAGTANVFACTWVGAEQVVLPRFDAAAVLRTIEREEITHTVLVPTMLQMLLDAPGASEADLSSLRHIHYAASPISPELQARVLERLPVRLRPVLRHDGGISARRPPRTRRSPPAPGPPVLDGGPLEGSRSRSAGRRRAAHRERSARCGPRAERDARLLAASGGHRGGAGRRLLPLRRHRSRTRGYLRMVDRAKDMIITGGENVYTSEVEAALVEHEGVAEAAVFGIPDQHWGETVHAAVTVRRGGDGPRTSSSSTAGAASPASRRRARSTSGPSRCRSRARARSSNLLRRPFWEGRDRRVS